MINPLDNVIKLLGGFTAAEFSDIQAKLASAEACTSMPITKGPRMTGMITQAAIQGVLEKNGLQRVWPWADIGEASFSTCDVKDAQAYQELSNIQNRSWTAPGQHDCNNFSFQTLGWWSCSAFTFPIGSARSSTHRFNVFIDTAAQLWILEPQLNSWFLYQDRALHAVNGLNYDIISEVL
jgi:hypothetical protein